jgi:protein-S-isoprenylcysteine O-methyltransferase Ste14
MSQVHIIGPDFTGSRSFKFIAFIYGMASYLVFFGTILYAIGFVMGLVVPKTIDTGTSKSVTEAVVVNLLLMSLFAVQHSVMARACCCCSGSGVRFRLSCGSSPILTWRRWSQWSRSEAGCWCSPARS